MLMTCYFTSQSLVRHHNYDEIQQDIHCLAKWSDENMLSLQQMYVAVQQAQ